MVILKITRTITTDPTTINTKKVMLTLELGWFPLGVGFGSLSSGSAWGINKATCTILDTFDVKLLLSTLWMAMNMWVAFSSEIFPGLNVNISLELASFGDRSVLFTCRASSKLSLRSRMLPLILMIYCWTKKKSYM